MRISFTSSFGWMARLLLVGICLCMQWPVMAQSPLRNGDFKQFKITHWTTDDGLPTNTLIFLNQDKDGYLWIGSYDGLIRFDGSQFINYSKESTPNLSSFHARSLEEDSKGNLWIGTGNGLVKHYKGKFTDLTSDNFNFFIESLFYDEPAGKIWIGTRDSGLFIYDVETSNYTPIENQFSKDLINEITQDEEGGLWVGSEKNGLGRLHKGRWTFYGKNEGLANTEINCLFYDTEGLYIGTTAGLFLYNEDKIRPVEKFTGLRINKVKKDYEGRLWVATANGAFKRKHNGEWENYDKNRGLSNNDIRDMYFDSGKNTWLATYRGGLNQLRETNFITYSIHEGLDVEATGAFFELGSGEYLTASTDGRLYHIKDGKAKKVPLKTVLNQRIYWIHRDHLGNIWLASYQGLLLIQPNGQERLFTEADGLPTNQVRIITQDSRNQFWIGTRVSGLVQMTWGKSPMEAQFQSYRFNELQALNSTFIMGIEEDPQGNLLISSNTGGLNMITPDGSLSSITQKHKLKTNITYNARRDADGTYWLATSDGLVRIGEKAYTFTQKEGIPHESIFDVLEDNLGYFWMPSAQGIVRVEKAQLEAFAEGKASTIEWKVFDKNNELRKSECTGASNMFKDREGNLWFLMLNGLVSVNPQNISINKRLPHVVIEKILSDDLTYDMDGGPVFPASSQRVVIHYMGINLDYPGTTRYKYKLTNFDKDWVEARDDNVAVYTNLNHGTYTFQVMASNNDGIWNESGATLTFVVEPHFYQTWYFYLAVSLFFALTLYTYIRWRIHDVSRRAQQLEEMVEERTRMISRQRDELIALNEELTASQDQIMDQRDSLAMKNEQIAQINANLEQLVTERTKVLEEQNRRLSEYAFINAHELRGPLASILGLVHLFEISTDTSEKEELLKHLKKSSHELDKIVRATNRMLEGMERSREIKQRKEEI
jgi:ligand-binding sensor domain-containing protein